jgi:hypothetical protein
MTIAVSILFADVVGGTVFALVQSAFDRRDRDGLWAGWARD